MKTKYQTVVEQLIKRGEVSRNWCLNRYISRLGAIIRDLVNAGWKFDDRTSETGQTIIRGHWTKGKGDYVYKLVAFPKNYVKSK